MLEDLKKILYDHWLAIFSIFGVSIFSLLKVYIPLVASYPVPFWICAIAVLLSVSATLYLKREKVFVTNFSLGKPKKKIKEYGENSLYNVNWKIWMGYDEDFSDRRIWADGPFCILCDYELDDSKDKWFCATCEKKYKIPHHIRSCPREKVIKIFESKARSSTGLVAI